jgi:cytochrome P450
MSRAAVSKAVLRPGKTGLARWLERLTFGAIPYAFAFLRRWKPVLHLRGMVLTSRYDDVREVFATDTVFGVPYKAKLEVIMGGKPFFLGTDDTQLHRDDTSAMRKVILLADLPMLGKRVEEMAETIVEEARGRLEVVDTLVRQVTFVQLGRYFGIPDTPDRDLQVWATRLFEFQFADPGSDPKLRAEVDIIAPALRAHIDREIARRKDMRGPDDVLARCLAEQAAGTYGFTDIQIRTALTGFIVGGPPQPPMVVPQALEQLLRRPKALAEAQAAARANDDALLARYVLEAMRFDPLAPGLPRVALADAVIAAGTGHAAKVPKGATVMVDFASAMMDPRRVASPRRFDATRPDSDYIHFGYGLHQCFGIHINKATLHLMLKPLLKRKGLRRASGSAGRLRKNGPFAEALTVEFS